MKTSPQRHVLAVLRLKLKFRQKNFATFLDCRLPTLQSTELGRLKLSEELAKRVSARTGVSLEWLLENDLSRAPVKPNGEPYKYKDFEKAQHPMKNRKRLGREVSTIARRLTEVCWELARTCIAAVEAQRYEWWCYRVNIAARRLESEFQVPDSTAARHVSLGNELHVPGVPGPPNLLLISRCHPPRLDVMEKTFQEALEQLTRPSSLSSKRRRRRRL